MFNESIVIGITGPTGAGKSTLSYQMKKNGCEVIDVDLIGRNCVARSSKCLEQLVEYFGNTIILEDGELNRKGLAKLAFSSREATNKLNELTHPFILIELKKRVASLKRKGKIIVIDAALLFEMKANELCDYTISVVAPKDIRLKRIINRDNLTKKEALIRMNAQNDDEFYEMNCDFILKNDLGHDKLKIFASNLFLNLMEAINGQKDF